jgi:hypothetical protein
MAGPCPGRAARVATRQKSFALAVSHAVKHRSCQSSAPRHPSRRRSLHILPGDAVAAELHHKAAHG